MKLGVKFYGWGLAATGLAASLSAAELRCVEELIYPTRFEVRAQNVGGTLLGRTAVVVTPTEFATREVGIILSVSAIVGPLDTGVQLAAADGKRLEGTTDLMMAAAAGDAARTRQLVQAGANVNAANQLGATALMGAAAGGNTEVVKTLLASRAAVGARAQNGMTPLLAAARNGHAPAANLLLEKGAPVDMADNQGQTPLMHAVKNGHQDVATVVLSYGADVNRKDAAGKTPVQVATDLKKQNLVTLLTRPKTSVGLQRSKNPAAR